MTEDSKNCRNFAILAHIDHGKSTLADRLLEFTHTIEKRKMKEQLLDQMDLERERGITIKLQPVRMNYYAEIPKPKSQIQNKSQNSNNQNSKNLEIGNWDLEISNSKQDFVLNLIDTPGHVDFNYEVSRSLAAVEGAVLLVDATKGVQAQTLSNLYMAIEQGLEIIPVVNKIDLPNADVAKTKKEIIHILGCRNEDIILASGKTGQGVQEILNAIIQKVPAPRGKKDEPLRALIFDSKYDSYKGVLAYVRIVDGEVKRDDDVAMLATQIDSKVVEVGYFKPALVVQDNLEAGDIGYIATGLKSVEHCRVGDTIVNMKFKEQTEKLPGYKEVKPMVYASLYPVDGAEYNFMRDALEKLKLNDAAFTFDPESNPALGRGFRCGFLGLLHLEIIQERIKREFKINPTITTPSVVYKIKLSTQKEITIYSAAEMPDPSLVAEISEPYVKLEIITPAPYLGAIMELMQSTRSTYGNTDYINEDRLVLTFEAPLAEIITNFHDDLKSVSSGFASMNYEFTGFRAYDLVKLDILVANDRIEALSRLVPKERAFNEGKMTVEKLKKAIPRQNFAIAIQAAIGGKVIARETISPFRKDVISKLYGGDVTRKRKLLEKQKKGKKKMKNIGKVEIPSDAFLSVLKK